MPGPKIKVSIPTFNEIASKLEAIGVKIGVNDKEILLEKGDQLIRPIDWRLATVRQDCLRNAVTLVKEYAPDKVLEVAEDMLQYVLKGKVKDEKENTDKAEE